MFSRAGTQVQASGLMLIGWDSVWATIKKAVVPFAGTAVFLLVFTNALAIRAGKKGGKRKNEVESF